MFRYSYHPVVLTVIILAVLGLGYLIFTEPVAFIMRILMMIGFAAVLFFLFKTFIMPRMMRNQTPYTQQKGRYTQKTSHSKHSSPVPFPKKKKEKKKRNSRPLVKRQSDVKLTVIEGKKNKKKNRALF
ncbi:SA1362 family protein [Evansella halocellulosilytica]|uniref:SA1362 family protein n=1 Tax=Evansella halocellulosilytica TaxID=2011013 RepID=UPI000BB8DF18|nr:SA1362 family protein [Evansella halocellulosilytica]